MGSLSKRSPRRWSLEGLIPARSSVVRRACLRAPKRKKKTGPWPILELVLAIRGDVLCNMLAERGANKSDGWSLISSAAEWSMTIWRGTDATKIRDEECAPKSSVVRTYSEGVVRVVRVRRPTGGAPAISLLLWPPL